MVNNAPIPQQYLEDYLELQSSTVTCNPDPILQSGSDLIQAPLFAATNAKVRHDHMALAQLVIMLATMAADEKLEQASTRIYRHLRER